MNYDGQVRQNEKNDGSLLPLILNRKESSCFASCREKESSCIGPNWPPGKLQNAQSILSETSPLDFEVNRDISAV